MPKINDPQINSLNTLDGSELLYAVKDVTDNNVTMQVVKEFCNDGVASYPSLTDNANKVLTVNAAEDGVEWTTVSSGGVALGGGINVIEYDPSLHEVVTDTVDGADFESTRPHYLDDIPTSSWNPTTGVMGVANAAQTEGFPYNQAEYVGLRLTPSLYGMRGSFTIDASLCEDAWGFALLQHKYSGGFPIDLWSYLLVQHYKTVEDASLSQPQTFGWVLTETDEYGQQLWVTDPFDPQYARNEFAFIATKPQGVYTFHIGSVVDAYMGFSGLSYEQALEFFNTNFPPEQVAAILSTTLVYNTDLQTRLELKADTPYLHLFMNAYHKASQTGSHLLDPTSQLTITYDLEEVSNVPPTEAVDGDFLHLTENTKMFGKALVAGDFVQLYDNKTKMIVHANLDSVGSVGSVGSVNGQTGVVVLDADDVGATTQTYVDTQDNLIINSLTLKADTNYVDTQDTLLQDQIDLKANTTDVNQSLDLKANTTDVNQSLALKANTTDVNQSLDLKVDATYVDTQDNLLQDQIDLKADATSVSQSLSTKADLIGGLIPASQLPSYVDDVLNFTDLASFPSLGEDGKIYVAEDVNKTYRWGGSSYVESGGGGVALGETSSTAYRGDNGKIAYDHSQSQGNPHNTTTSDINEGTKLFFTEPRVRQTVLTGLNTSTASPALATDQLLAAIGKLQAQINNMGSGGGSVTWVNVKTIGTLNSIIDNSYTEIEVAKINGMLWLRGVARITSDLTGNIFTVTNSSYFLTIKRPPAFGAFYVPTTSDNITATFKIGSSWSISSMPDAYVLVKPSGGFSGTIPTTLNQSIQYLVIPAAPIGKLLTP